MHHGHACAHPPPAESIGCHGCAPELPRPRDDHADRDRRRLIATIGLTGVICAAEVAGGLVSGSLALLSDAGHMLTDVSAQVISLFALLLAQRPADDRRTFGYRRLEILAALANGVLLAGLAALMLVSAVRRFDHPPPIHTGVMIGVAVVGLIANGLAAFLLSHSHSLNVRGAYLHIVSDLLSSVAVVVGGIFMAVRPGLWIIDPVLGCLIAVIVLFSAWRLVRAATDELLETVPSAVDLEAVRRDLRSVPGVEDVHDLHVWSVGSGFVALSVHVVAGRAPGPQDELLREIDHRMRERHHIAHSTVQIESADFAAR